MAIDIVSGTTGAVTASGFNCDVEAWSANLTADKVAYRTFASQWKSQKNTAYALSGQFQGTIQNGAAGTKPVPSATGGEVNTASFEGVSFTLTADTGCTYTFTGNVTAVNVNRPSTDRMTGTFSFESDGAVSITWAEA